MTQLDPAARPGRSALEGRERVRSRARAAGLKVPSRFGTEVVARLLGLRTNHPAAEDAPRAAARRPRDARRGGVLGRPGARASRAGRSQPSRASPTGSPCRPSTNWQTAHPRHSRWPGSGCRTSGAARATAPRPTSASPRAAATTAPDSSGGSTSCRVSDERLPPLVIRGRTTYQMSGEVPASKRIGFEALQPADVIFFGDKGPTLDPPRSTTSASTSATAGSSSRRATGSISPRSTAGTRRNSPGPAAAGRGQLSG